MIYLIDTDICIYVIKKYPIKTIQKFKTIPPDDIGISSLTIAELQYGISKCVHQKINQHRLNEFLHPLAVIPFNHNAAIVYGSIRAQLENTGKIIGPIDMLIAAQALQEQLILVTNNEKEIKRVKGLKVENWCK